MDRTYFKLLCCVSSLLMACDLAAAREEHHGPSYETRAEAPSKPSQTFTTIAAGDWSASSTWQSGNAPGFDVDGDVVTINHDITSVTGDIKLINGATLTATGISFTMDPGKKFTIENGSATFTNCTFLQLNNLPNNTSEGGDGDGVLEITTSGGTLTMTGCDVWVASNFTNSEGTRILQNVCLKVDENYQNTGSDDLDNVCAQVGYERVFFGSGSGDWQNNGPGTMQLDDSEIRTCNGNLQNQSGATLSGAGNVLWVQYGNLDNAGTWTAGVVQYCVDQSVTGNFNGNLPGTEECGTISSFFNPCVCVPVELLHFTIE